MSATVRWNGLDELLEQLRNLPADLTAEAGHIIEASANAAAVQVRSGYGSHRRTGKLQESVVVDVLASGEFGVVRRLRATAKHAHLVEYGTQARHTAIGANRGSMPPAHIFVPAVLRNRRQMYEALKDLVLRHGATSVTGEP